MKMSSVSRVIKVYENYDKIQTNKPQNNNKKKAVATIPLWERFCAVKWPKK
jgi:hypothetical protein